jgi:proteasome activator subunit 4
MDALLTLYAPVDSGQESPDDHLDMGDEDILSDATLSDSFTHEQTDMEKQLASLKTYVSAVPYECESVEEMQAKLENIVGKIFVCAKAKNWFLLSTWDGLLQW